MGLWRIIVWFFCPQYKVLEEKAIARLEAAEGVYQEAIQTAKERAQKEIANLTARIKQLNEQQHLLQFSVDKQQEVLSGFAERSKALKSELALLENDSRFDLAEAGFYSPKYDFDTAVEYISHLVGIRDQQRNLLQGSQACVCDSNWSINGNKHEGAKVSKKIMQLMLRAFNGETDSIIAKVKFGNVEAFENRIAKAFEAINKLGSGFSCRITAEYLHLKTVELHLVYEYNEKVYQEKEEQKAIREQMREEEKAAKETEKAKEKAEEEEDRYRRALEQAQKEVQQATATQQQELQSNIRYLEKKLQEAIENGKRAVSMAQQTKRGHVYIISNIGSFGEDVFKIGMTRRLNPQDRVDELGGSSVPFRFDVHAMILCEDAPKLENALHKALDAKRVNKVNRHKEFFNVPFEEIEKIVQEHRGELKLTKLAEAKDYRKSLQF